MTTKSSEEPWVRKGGRKTNNTKFSPNPQIQQAEKTNKWSRYTKNDLSNNKNMKWTTYKTNITVLAIFKKWNGQLLSTEISFVPDSSYGGMGN